jgi:hypothetical protein
MKPTTVSIAVLALLAACGGSGPDTQPTQATPVQGNARPLLPIDLPPSPAPTSQR